MYEHSNKTVNFILSVIISRKTSNDLENRIYIFIYQYLCYKINNLLHCSNKHNNVVLQVHILTSSNMI